MQAAMMLRTANCNKVREDVARLIYLYLSKHEFFGIPLLGKQGPPPPPPPPLPAERLSCLYTGIQWIA